jgi:hypothetical protein
MLLMMVMYSVMMVNNSDGYHGNGTVVTYGDGGGDGECAAVFRLLPGKLRNETGIFSL